MTPGGWDRAVIVWYVHMFQCTNVLSTMTLKCSQVLMFSPKNLSHNESRAPSCETAEQSRDIHPAHNVDFKTNFFEEEVPAWE